MKNKYIDKNFKYDIKDLRKLTEKEMCSIFKALGDQQRYMIAKMIFHNPGVIGKEILADIKMSQPDLSFHIKQLKECNLIIDIRNGQTHQYFSNYKTILCFNLSLMHEYGSFAHRIDELFQKEKELLKDK